MTFNPFDGCKDEYVVGGVDEVSQRIAATAPLVDDVLDAIAVEPPSAEVYVVNCRTRGRSAAGRRSRSRSRT